MNHDKLLDDYYSAESISEWKAIIGKDLHYHYGFFSSQETTLEQGLEKAIRNFYDYIPSGSNVLDAGCGWGGPAGMLTAEKACSVFGITISRAQYEYCYSTGMQVQQSDLEQVEIHQNFDVIAMFESLEHIKDKARLFDKLRRHGKRLVLRTTCTAFAEAANKPEFSDTMYLVTPVQLTQLLERANWKIVSMKNRREESRLTLCHWKQRLETAYRNKSPPGHLGDLLDLSNHALSNWRQWSRVHPLMDIVAD